MKKLYYTIGTVVGVIGLIIAFENILFRYMIWILFYRFNGSLFFPFILVFVMGMVSGWCFAMGRSLRSHRSLNEFDV